VSLLPELIIKLDKKRYLKIWRGLLHYTISLAFYHIGKTEHQEERILSASSSYYYGAFHLALATYIIHPKSSFKVKSWFRLANSRKPYRWRTPFGHRKLVDEIKNLSASNNDFLAIISDFLNKSRDMREFSHYGPYIEISENPNPRPGTIYSPFKFNFIGHLFEKEKGESPKKIKKNKEKPQVMYMKLYENFEVLLNKFNEYFISIYDDRSWDVRLAILHLPFLALRIYPYVPHKTFKFLNEKLDEFAKKLGNWHYEAFSKAKKMKMYREAYSNIKARTKGIFSLY